MARSAWRAPDLSAGELREHARAGRDREGDGAVRRRSTSRTCGPRRTICWRHRRGARDRPRGGRAGGDLPPEGGGPAELGEGGRGHRADRLARRGGAGRGRRHVPVHRRRHGPDRVLPAVDGGRRQAVRQPGGPRGAREDPRGDGRAQTPTGRTWGNWPGRRTS